MISRKRDPLGRRRSRKWLPAGVLLPTLLLPAALAGASSAVPLPLPELDARSAASVRDPENVGVNGTIPEEHRPSPDLLKQATRPSDLATGAGDPVRAPEGPLGIPEPVLAAYTEAADRLSVSDPSCGAHWSVLASIGRVESGHARSGQVDSDGTTVSAILGPRLDGHRGSAAIPDTDAGRLDGDPVWDRAVGPMQFIPSTWRKFESDGNADGVANPHNVHDAALAAGDYLCSGGSDVSEPRELAEAVFRYNQSDDYVRTVLVWAAAYAKGVTPTPAETAPVFEDKDILAGQRISDEPAVVAIPKPGERQDGNAPVPEVVPPAIVAPPPAETSDPPDAPSPDPPPPDVDAPWAPTPPPAPDDAQPPGSVPPPDPAPVVPPPAEPPVEPPAPELPAEPPTEESPRPELPVEPTPVQPQPGLPPFESPGPPPVERPTEPATERPSEEPPPAPAEPAPAEPAPAGPMPSPDSPPPALVPPEPSTSAAGEQPECSVVDLATGEFRIEEQQAAQPDLAPGTSDLSSTVPGTLVYVEAANPGELKPCVVPEAG